MPLKKALKPKKTKKKPTAKKQTAPKKIKKAATGKVPVKKRKISFSVSKKTVRSRTKKIVIPVASPIILSPEMMVKKTTPVVPPVSPAPREEFVFPQGYGDNKAVLMVRDPYWLFTYWELRHKEKAEAQEKAGRGACECLRLYKNDVVCFDIEIGGMANNWYVSVPEAGASYWIEIGFRSPDGRFFAVVRSNVVATPLDRMSDMIDEEWMIPDWDALYA
ncbi:MAG: DUF4912 domain-containing protein, partial [Candidatus Margulisiibacteriota bacterium]